MAGPTVEFDYPSDSQMPKIFASAEAFLFAAYEDFGVTPVESMAAGTPVIAYKAGGALDYITPGKTGEFFTEQTVESLMQAIQAFDPKKYNNQRVQDYAGQFSPEQFRSKIIGLITKKMVL